MPTETAVKPADERFQPAEVRDLPAIKGQSGMMSFIPKDFGGLMEMSKLMAQSGAAVPKHLRANPGMCLSVAMVAYQNGFNPFLLALDTYVVNDILAYGAKSISAIVDNSPLMLEPLQVGLSGEWPRRVALVTGRFRGVNEPRTLEVFADTITTRNSPLWKQQPDQQLLYFAKRAWARVWLPGALLGMLGEDERDAVAERATDITPARPDRKDFAEVTASAGRIEAAEPDLTDIPANLDRRSAVDDDKAEIAQFEFVDADGEATACDYSGFANRFAAAIDKAPDESSAEGVWETNSPQLSRLRIEEGGEGLAADIGKRYNIRMTGLREAAKKHEEELTKLRTAAMAMRDKVLAVNFESDLDRIIDSNGALMKKMKAYPEINTPLLADINAVRERVTK